MYGIRAILASVQRGIPLDIICILLLKHLITQILCEGLINNSVMLNVLFVLNNDIHKTLILDGITLYFIF